MIKRLLSVLRPWPKHPIDARYNIETSRHFPRFMLRTGTHADGTNYGYVGAQPSILRRCLNLLPVDGAEFFDLGCGKGRMLAAAAEYPFKEITGIEIVQRLAKKARANMRKLGRPVQVLNADATAPILSSRTAVLFLYNPFGADQISRLLVNLRSAPAKLYVIYYNPVHANLFDHSGFFERLYAELIPFASEERESSPFGNTHDSVVVWQSRCSPMLPPMPGADRKVIVRQVNYVGEVVMD